MTKMMTKLRPPTKRAQQKWLDVPNTNPIARRMSAAEFKLGDLGSTGGVGLRAVYLCGPPGIGKTHQIIAQERAWRGQGIDPIRVRPSNVRDLIDHFAEADGRRPIVMEEADIIFRSKPMFEVLKQATDPLTPDFLYRIVVIEKEKVQMPVNLNVPIIVSTNMDLTSDDGWDKDLLPDRDALFNRSWPVVFAEDPIALWEWSVYLALTTFLTMEVMLRHPNGGPPIPQENPLAVQAQAIEWFTENLNRLAVISPRTLKFIAQCMGRAHRKDMPVAIMQDELEALLLPERSEPVTLPRKENWAGLLRFLPKQSPPARLLRAA
ncbi:ATP-binding protein [Qipengyuania atrilutea]|uniref:ATP-binding protein n=1 Tax=Qipengyuania atrilutea TaxID=2744473 RepID=A0A850H8M2_9SPHN|nr:ATP-binding protein [Actirhodobacter atriluteus]NVD46143.1 ATP-binding protein [Actirhodobacter atriluteus]